MPDKFKYEYSVDEQFKPRNVWHKSYNYWLRMLKYFKSILIKQHHHKFVMIMITAASAVNYLSIL